MPKPNTQKTKKELQAEIDDKVKAVDSMTDEENQEEEELERDPDFIDPDEEEPKKEEKIELDSFKVTEVAEEESGEEEEEEKPEDTEETEEEVVEEKPTEKPKPDYKKKFSDSSREAQILYAKNKRITEAIEKASVVAEPTEDELKTEYPEWDMMSDFEKKMSKDSMMNRRKLDTISEVTKDFKDMDAWNKKVDDFLENVETVIDNPGLDGKEEEFKIFATKETRRGVDFETLTSAFLFNVEENKPPKKKGKMFETGSGGTNEKPEPKSDILSVEDGVKLKKTNYKKYMDLLKDGKIKTVVD